MKHGDPLLLAWQTTISRKGDDAAIFDATGRIARSFRDIEGHARAFEAKMDKLLAGRGRGCANWQPRRLASGFHRVSAQAAGCSAAGPVHRRATTRRSVGDLQSERSSVRGPQRKFSADHSAEDSRHYSGLGRECTLALETYLGHNGSAACNSISQPSIAGRLQSDLRHDGHFR